MPSSTATPHNIEIVEVPFQLIVGNRQEFKADMLERFAAGKDLILDFSGTVYLDSSGLGVLYAINKAGIKLGRRLAFCGLNGDLLTLFELTRMDTVLPLTDTLSSALAKLGADAG
jgi:anti-anti-sigma factor